MAVQELSSRHILWHWLEAAHLRRMRKETGRFLQHKTATVVLSSALTEWRAWRVACRVMRRMYMAAPFACWRERVVEKASARRRLLQAAQVIMFGGLSRAFQAWRQDTEVRDEEDARCTAFYWANFRTEIRRPSHCRRYAASARLRPLLRCLLTTGHMSQLRCAKRAAFERKQHALREAVQMGDRLARRRRQSCAAACLTAWRMTAAKYRSVRAALQRSTMATLEGSYARWRHFTLYKVHHLADLVPSRSGARYSRVVFSAWLLLLPSAILP